MNQQHAKRILKLLDARGQRGLSDTAGLGRAPKMSFTRHGEQKFKLIVHAREKQPLLYEPRSDASYGLT